MTELEEICFVLSSLIRVTDWEHLSDRQKDVLADAIDRTAARIDAAEGIDPGDELAYLPEPRPWRTDQHGVPDEQRRTDEHGGDRRAAA
ncbi:hypothetical protein GCG21_09090 [Pseudactinotalea sp. HY160]|uniref:hypothetical protein n=1 Tax=Pseudactinotalea sp. HY160 TaxID=2654490 RepID=UPI00128B5EB7|nr:hypothetical protein [Pseudactinotalea sp. HY160]MPV50157.1 hypothetical protein [Pseudactinotalea sp. HY160]